MSDRPKKDREISDLVGPDNGKVPSALRITSNRLVRPSLAFAFRFGNTEGFVQRFFAHHRDLVARELGNGCDCFLAFKSLGSEPSLSPKWAHETQLDLFDLSSKNRLLIETFIRDNNTKVVVFQSATIGEIDISFFHQLGVATVSTEDSSFDHASKQPFWVAAIKFLVRNVAKYNVHDFYVANTIGQRDFLITFAKLPPERVGLVRYGIDLEHFTPTDRNAACVSLGLDPQVTWIMAASQARPEKRVDLVMFAVAKAMEERPGERLGFFYVGGGIMLEEWMASAEALPQRTAFRFFGGQTDMRQFYSAASIFVHGSFIESFGLVLTEAMASCLPVIATDAHGPAEIIDNGKTGCLIGRDDWQTFTEAIISYVDQPEVARMHGQHGRLRCQKYFSSDRCASEMADVLRPLLGSA